MPLPSGSEQKSLNDTSSRNHASAWERTAGRFCCNKLNPKAMGCVADLVSKHAAGQNNSNLTS
ncbi:MAG TPA: hypothetical protein VMV47_05515 [Bacteroidales bacterium]|nr:hypothetical protein [Bacteroidales bacterium]